MAQSSPTRPSATAQTGDKRPHEDSDDNSDEDAEKSASVAAPRAAVNQNLTGAVQRYITKKCLRGEQAADIEVFFRDPVAVREAKIYAQGLHLENLLNTIRVATPPWVVSDEPAKNIYSYCAAVLLSDKLAAYKGNVPKNIVFAILKKHRFDLPPGIERIPADWGKVNKAVENAQTQFRSTLKKAIRASLKVNRKDKTLAPKAQQKNIFDLTTLIVENTQCEVNVLLCARVAFMRKHFIKDPSSGYWDTVDRALEKIRTKAQGDPIKVARAFRHILKKDRANHGDDDYAIDDTVDAIQAEVDSIIGDGAMSTASQSEAVDDGGEDDAGGGDDST
ncbi:hypothetical protein MVEN_01136700 [Mycena venus]|uniref:Uncharacterized protein n=1 Tax=Mycena venus TaxID=2733690 RepID=A0A8H7CY15_9AGAR|nr:hypothetical protein MVEN_01136700 [Mycena venus]